MPNTLVRLLVAATLLSISTSVLATAQRTFVASYGNDANICSLVQPCRGFAAALSLANDGGEVIVLDSAGYGTVNIAKSVSIIAPPGVYAGIAVPIFGPYGVSIDGPSIVVVLRGLSINGQGGGGNNGIQFVQGSRLYVEQCTISGVGIGGIYMNTGHAFVTDTTIRDTAGYGIAAYGSLYITIDRSRIERNFLGGVSIANGATMTVTDSVIADNLGAGGISVASDNGSSETAASISESTISQNYGQGVIAEADQTGSIVRLALTRNTISGNAGAGVSLRAVPGGLGTGVVTGVITDNAIVRSSNNGLVAVGSGVSMTIATNAISGNSADGVVVASGAVLKTRGNNIIQDNTNNISGALTYVVGD